MVLLLGNTHNTQLNGAEWLSVYSAERKPGFLNFSHGGSWWVSHHKVVSIRRTEYMIPRILGVGAGQGSAPFRWPGRGLTGKCMGHMSPNQTQGVLILLNDYAAWKEKHRGWVYCAGKIKGHRCTSRWNITSLKRKKPELVCVVKQDLCASVLEFSQKKERVGFNVTANHRGKVLNTVCA